MKNKPLILIIVFLLTISSTFQAVQAKKRKKTIKYEFNKKNSITLHGFIGKKMYKKFLKDVKKFKNKKMNILINSNGGKIFYVNKIVGYINKNNIKTTCMAAYSALSGGFMILQSCDKRLALPKSILMMHKVYCNLPPCTRIREINLIVQMQMARSLSMPYKMYNSFIKDGNWWMTGRMAYQYNAVDEVVERERIKIGKFK